MGWATFLAIFPEYHPVTLLPTELALSFNSLLKAIL
jgi:hypothetical protein